MSDLLALKHHVSACLNHRHLHWAQLACDRCQTTHAQQVIRRPDEPGMHLNRPDAAHHGFAQTAIGLHPAEDFLHAFVLLLTDGVTRVARGACSAEQAR